MVSGCESCLLAHRDFGPFVFRLILEKIVDEEYSIDTKLEVCTFLAKACSIFPTEHLTDATVDLCAGIRSVLFNLPRSESGDCIPKSIEISVVSMLEAMKSTFGVLFY
ncbi:unnamed protein product [Gongylonema pulchrum]|uniref:MMS19 nucleotide excision repair protein n=1 Tax=Gongylonema pulchrum TaxID=637853 RepID=A0A3P7MSN9_9BILA|nr:unnamed protein product [Gongylonema pulchrum]